MEKEQTIGPYQLNTIVVGDCLDIMAQMPDGCVDLVVTSPPFNIGKDYGEAVDDLLPMADYLSLMGQILEEILRITRRGGRLAWNTPFTGNTLSRKKGDGCIFYPELYLPLMQKRGWIFRDFVIWVKSRREEDENSFCGNDTSWGSWLSPNCPYLRCYAEAILIGHKESKFYGRKDGDITKEEFLRFTKNVWFFPAETKRSHPAPFPEELPRRILKLFSVPGDLIFDPFMGSGTTAVVADRLGRNFFGCDINPNYVEASLERLEKARALRPLMEKYRVQKEKCQWCNRKVKVNDLVLVKLNDSLVKVCRVHLKGK